MISVLFKRWVHVESVHVRIHPWQHKGKCCRASQRVGPKEKTLRGQRWWPELAPVAETQQWIRVGEVGSCYMHSNSMTLPYTLHVLTDLEAESRFFDGASRVKPGRVTMKENQSPVFSPMYLTMESWSFWSLFLFINLTTFANMGACPLALTVVDVAWRTKRWDGFVMEVRDEPTTIHSSPTEIDLLDRERHERGSPSWEDRVVE